MVSKNNALKLHTDSTNNFTDCKNCQVLLVLY